MSSFYLSSLPDLDSRSASNLISLVNTLKTEKCSIALGAGMSASVGLPTWEKFLRRIVYSYFEYWIFEIVNKRRKSDYLNPPKNIPAVFTVGYDILLIQSNIEQIKQKIGVITEEKDTLIQDISSMMQVLSSKLDSLNLEQLKRLYIEKFNINDDKILDTLDFKQVKSMFIDSLKLKLGLKEKQDNVEIYESEESLSYEKIIALNKKLKEEEALKASLKDFISTIETKGNLLVAQMIKNQVKENHWNYLLRKALYHSYEFETYEFKTSPLMESCIRLVQLTGINKILNYNYDDTFYHGLLESGVKFDNIYCGKISKKPSIYYPHGYIPLKGGVITETVLTEHEYQRQSSQTDLWSNIVQIGIFNNTSSIFIGLSMEDPNLRRILNMCNQSSQKIHYAFLPKSGFEPVPDMVDALFDADLMNLGIKVIRYPQKDGSYRRMPEIIDTIIKAVNNEIKLI